MNKGKTQRLFIIANLSIVPHGLVALWVDIVSIQCDVGQLPLQALGFDFLEGCLADEVGRLDAHRHKQLLQP